MSVVILGMDMPKNGCCHCFLREGNYCSRLEEDENVVEYAKKSERHPKCPLIEVQTPHGRLIDMDALKLFTVKYKCSGGELVDALPSGVRLADISEAPIIIGAELIV